MEINPDGDSGIQAKEVKVNKHLQADYAADEV